MDLFEYQPAPSYPHVPGYRGTDTSRQAAESINANVLRAKVLAKFQTPGCWMTADEVAESLGIDKLSIRPRCSELSAKGLIRDSGERRPNASGRGAIVWCIV